jgi:hypothetical protein
LSDTRIGTVERAFQLARAVACRSVPEIRERLTAEGYEGVFSHLERHEHQTPANRSALWRVV